MSILSVSGLSMDFAERSLFKNISFFVEKGDKVGLIGANGTGKTTLFKILTGQLEQTGGSISREKGLKIGYMEQFSCSHLDRTVYTELLSIFQPLISMEERLNSIVEEIENGNHSEKLLEEQMILREKFENNGGLTYVSRTNATLVGLGFGEDSRNMSVEKLSGGQRSKIALAKLLLSNPDILLLDEPTNHLDISAVSWLENFVKEYKGSAIIISHDRYFLDKVTNKTIEIEHGKSRMYVGSYSEFIEKKQKILEEQKAHYEQQMKEIHRIEGIVEQQRRWGVAHNFITAASKQKQAYRIKAELEIPESEIETVNFTFSPKCETGDDVLICENLEKYFGDKKIFSDVNIHIRKGERVFILGENGCGKTTLLKIINNIYTANAGSVYLGANVEMGYFDQVQSGLDLKKTALEQIWDRFPYLTETQVRTSLGRFLFKGDEVFRSISEMSGGERARIALLELMLKGANFLLLDEPTNHLDTSFRENLEKTLLEYSGTMLIVSHDRYFINKLAHRVLVLDQNGVKEYLGNYDYYIEKTSPEVNKDIFQQPKKDKEKKTQNEYFKRKEERSQLARAKANLKKCEEAIENTEAEIAKIQEEISLIQSDYEKLVELTQKLGELNEHLDQLYEQWAELN